MMSAAIQQRTAYRLNCSSRLVADANRSRKYIRPSTRDYADRQFGSIHYPIQHFVHDTIARVCDNSIETAVQNHRLRNPHPIERFRCDKHFEFAPMCHGSFHVAERDFIKTACHGINDEGDFHVATPTGGGKRSAELLAK
jgi:hypothetical protein